MLVVFLVLLCLVGKVNDLMQVWADGFDLCAMSFLPVGWMLRSYKSSLDLHFDSLIWRTYHQSTDNQ